MKQKNKTRPATKGFSLRHDKDFRVVGNTKKRKKKHTNILIWLPLPRASILHILITSQIFLTCSSSFSSAQQKPKGMRYMCYTLLSMLWYRFIFVVVGCPPFSDCQIYRGTILFLVIYFICRLIILYGSSLRLTDEINKN
jgi:hypothetical protein